MSTTATYSHEDKGEKNSKEILWYSLDGSTREISPFLVLPKRPMGCQFINPHNSLILNVFNFNTNIQIGNVLQIFYSTLYTSKSLQEEDSDKQLRIGRAVIQMIQRLLDDQGLRDTSKEQCNQVRSETSFREGLCRVLSGLNTATTRNVTINVLGQMANLKETSKGKGACQVEATSISSC
jgi:hypothetical protein